MANKSFLARIGFIACLVLFLLILNSGTLSSIVGRFPKHHQIHVRLYVLDCGILENLDTKRFGLNRDEVSNNKLFVPCFLVVHPKGILVWDTGMVADSAWKPTGSPARYHIVLPGVDREVTLRKPLKAQLAEIGYSPDNIKYLTLSHYHYDHTANANDFSGATWLVRSEERDSMFSKTPPGVTNPSSYAKLLHAKTIILKKDEYDVFEDGSVVIKSAPGHTPGHLVLFVKLAKTGNILLSGDLYHFPEERTLDRVPTFEFNAVQTRATRKEIEKFLEKTGAQLWIQHDFDGDTRLKKSPDYYE